MSQESPGRHKGYDYARSINPTRSAYERCVADLESGTSGWAFASGLAAMSTALETIDSGSHVVVSDDLYGGTSVCSKGCDDAPPISISRSSI